MSWQVYVDSNLVGTGRITKAAILGQQGGVWAASPGYNIPPAEQNAIISAFSKPDDLWATGFKLAGEKFFTIKAESDRIYGKKGGDGVSIVKTKQAILIAEYAAPTQAQEANPIVEGLGDYLKGVGY